MAKSRKKERFLKRSSGVAIINKKITAGVKVEMDGKVVKKAHLVAGNPYIEDTSGGLHRVAFKNRMHRMLNQK